MTNIRRRAATTTLPLLVKIATVVVDTTSGRSGQLAPLSSEECLCLEAGDDARLPIFLDPAASASFTRAFSSGRV